MSASTCKQLWRTRAAGMSASSCSVGFVIEDILVHERTVRVDDAQLQADGSITESTGREYLRAVFACSLAITLIMTGRSGFLCGMCVWFVRRERVPALLSKVRLAHSGVRVEGTPRRLAVMVDGLAGQQPLQDTKVIDGLASGVTLEGM